jgi:hypothetical protein
MGILVKRSITAKPITAPGITYPKEVAWPIKELIFNLDIFSTYKNKREMHTIIAEEKTDITIEFLLKKYNDVKSI